MTRLQIILLTRLTALLVLAWLVSDASVLLPLGLMMPPLFVTTCNCSCCLSGTTPCSFQLDILGMIDNACDHCSDFDGTWVVTMSGCIGIVAVPGASSCGAGRFIALVHVCTNGIGPVTEIRLSSDGSSYTILYHQWPPGFLPDCGTFSSLSCPTLTGASSCRVAATRHFLVTAL
jgi:hypothetical protein